MKNRLLLLLTFMMIVNFSFAQKDITDMYDSFKVFRNSNLDHASYEQRCRLLLENTSLLSKKQLINIRYHMGRNFERMKLPDSALKYYLLVEPEEPNYEVMNWAIGFIYITKATPYVAKINEAVAKKDAVANKNAFEAYKKQIYKALPYLEKYYACTQDEDTMKAIKRLYTQIKDTQGLANFDHRVKKLPKDCVTLLEDN
ncbi:hypothetical protein [Pedobacter montanisoli]|uniref:Uncharacterized protein n=1 Tax=Pedobacter montanisoli TaxID=2923277 RepID=A0ABS9ZZR8_9SPHI|nr:hypothetical protein [Pedobacter montanisoli]MCJ0743804.1 hypothetical protein [Pedobacter montanisoli]